MCWRMTARSPLGLQHGDGYGKITGSMITLELQSLTGLRPRQRRRWLNRGRAALQQQRSRAVHPAVLHGRKRGAGWHWLPVFHRNHLDQLLLREERPGRCNGSVPKCRR